MDEEIDSILEESYEADETFEEVEEAEEAPVQEPKAEKPKETPDQKKSRLERQLKQIKKQLGEEDEPAPSKTKPGELDDTQLDYLDLKGIDDPTDIKLISKVMRNTGQTLRDTLKDEYVVSKLKESKSEREVKAATPSGTKRAGNQSSNLEFLIGKAERTGELPNDFETRTAVLNAITERSNNNKPAWQR